MVKCTKCDSNWKFLVRRDMFLGCLFCGWWCWEYKPKVRILVPIYPHKE